MAHRKDGLAAGVKYIHDSPACTMAVVNFTVLRQVAEYRDLPTPSGAKTFYIVEAKDTDGTVFFILTVVHVVPKGTDA
jgi:hypothetical protein